MDLSESRPVLDVARDVIGPIVWCMVTTVGADGRPRMRLLHPVWSWDTDADTRAEVSVPRALVATRPTPLKRAHLAANPVASCGYWSPDHHTVVIDAHATWLPDSERADAWRRIRATPEPMGYDPAPIWPNGPDDDGFAVIELRPFRITVRPAGQPARAWRPDMVQPSPPPSR